MSTYSKIETAYVRDEQFRVDVSRLRRSIYGCISTWVATEKVDGTNMRIGFAKAPGETSSPVHGVWGKTDSASIPFALLTHCQDLAGRVKCQISEIMTEHDLASYTLHGEGYGPKIQKGGRYRPDQGFILFDVEVGDGVFLSDEQVTATADLLGIPRVPVLGEMTLAAATTLAQAGFESLVAAANGQTMSAEGLVLRTVEPLYDNRGERLIVKLKGRDF